jgi:hypothetical protein
MRHSSAASSKILRPQYLGGQLRGIAARVVDLLPVAQEHWYHPEQRGSWSIKAVLPTIGPGVSYDGLAVKDGGAAQRFYMEAISPGTSDERRREIDRALRDYCGLDSEAMIRLHRHLCGSSQQPAVSTSSGVTDVTVGSVPPFWRAARKFAMVMGQYARRWRRIPPGLDRRDEDCRGAEIRSPDQSSGL